MKGAFKFHAFSLKQISSVAGVGSRLSLVPHYYCSLRMHLLPSIARNVILGLGLAKAGKLLKPCGALR